LTRTWSWRSSSVEPVTRSRSSVMYTLSSSWHCATPPRRLLGQHRRRGLHQSQRVAPGTGGGPFSIFCVLCLLAEPRHLLLRGLPPFSGQRTPRARIPGNPHRRAPRDAATSRPAAWRAPALGPRTIRRRPPARRQPPAAPPPRPGPHPRPGRLAVRDGGAGRARSRRPRPDALRGLPRRSQIWDPPAERRQADSGSLVRSDRAEFNPPGQLRDLRVIEHGQAFRPGYLIETADRGLFVYIARAAGQVLRRGLPTGPRDTPHDRRGRKSLIHGKSGPPGSPTATSAAVPCSAFPTASGVRRCAATRSARPARCGSASLAPTDCASITSCSSGPTMPGSGTTPSWIGHWPWPRAQTSPPGRTFASV
jgi:hypothetical protein